MKTNLKVLVLGASVILTSVFAQAQSSSEVMSNSNSSLEIQLLNCRNSSERQMISREKSDLIKSAIDDSMEKNNTVLQCSTDGRSGGSTFTHSLATEYSDCTYENESASQVIFVRENIGAVLTVNLSADGAKVVSATYNNYGSVSSNQGNILNPHYVSTVVLKASTKCSEKTSNQ